MRTALAASVAAVAKWISGAAPLGLQAVPKRQSVWSIAAGTRFARPVPQPESRHIDLPEQGQVYVESLLIMLQPALQPLPNGFLWLLLWGCSCSGTAVCVVNSSLNKICPSRSATRKPPY